MMRVACIRAEWLLERRTAGLTSADALRLEEHLSDCERCSEQARLLSGLGALLHASTETSLSLAARERVVAGAFRQVLSAQAAARAWQPPPLRTMAPMAALGALCGLVLGLALRGNPAATPAPSAGANLSTPANTSAALHGSPKDRVLKGQLAIDGQIAGEGSALAADAALVADEPASLALAQATVELAAGTHARWQSAERRLRLEAGSVRADVDPRPHRSFTVETPDFSVLVLGTRFEVSLEGVSVERGRVRVLAKDGRVLAAMLGPGQRFALAHDAHAEGSTEAARADAHASVPKLASPVRFTGRSPVRIGPQTPAGRILPPAAATPAPTVPPAAPSPDAAALIAAARSELAAKRVSGARQRIDAALALAPAQSLRAEAMSLRAECALVEGDLGGATAAYLSVANEFGQLPAGENALFAAARVEADRGRKAAAIEGLNRYLGHYPHGRFVKEAKARLRELGAPAGL